MIADLRTSIDQIQARIEGFRRQANPSLVPDTRPVFFGNIETDEQGNILHLNRNQAISHCHSQQVRDRMGAYAHLPSIYELARAMNPNDLSPTRRSLFDSRIQPLNVIPFFYDHRSIQPSIFRRNSKYLWSSSNDSELPQLGFIFLENYGYINFLSRTENRTPEDWGELAFRCAR